MMRDNFFSLLPKESQFLVESQSLSLDFKRGEFIYRCGDLPKGIYFIKKGLVGLTINGAESGREHLLRLFNTHHFFGHRAFLNQEKYHANAVAIENAQLILIPQQLLTKLLEKYPSLYKHFSHVLADELKQAESMHVMILENQVLPRTAHALIYLKEAFPQHNWTRQEIANFTASTVSTIIKAMAELERLGYIAQNGREFNIINKEALLNLNLNMK